MNLEYRNLAEWGKLNRKLKDSNRKWYWSKPSTDEIEGWRLQMFTCDKAAKQESVNNLELLKAKAQEIESPVLIVKGNEISFVGTYFAVAATDLSSDQWCEQFEEDNTRKYYASRPYWCHQVGESDLHEYSMSFFGNDNVFARAPQIGFYDIVEDRKVTDRREQIQKLWDLGFVARRGRPVSAANIRHSGTPSEVALASKLAQQLWHRKLESEVAKKACSIYTSINRYYCWPGSW